MVENKGVGQGIENAGKWIAIGMIISAMVLAVSSIAIAIFRALIV